MSERASDEKVPALDTRQLSALAETFRLLGDPTRLRILMFCLNGPKPVKQIADSLDLSRPSSATISGFCAGRAWSGENVPRGRFSTRWPIIMSVMC